jgi:hypothetical protein
VYLVLALVVSSACSSNGDSHLSDALLTSDDIRIAGYDGPLTVGKSDDYLPNPDPRGPCGATGDAALDFNDADARVILEGTGLIVIHVVVESPLAPQRVAAMRADAVEGCSAFVSQTNTGSQLNEMLGLIDIGLVGEDRVAWRGSVRPSNSELRINVIASVVLVRGHLSAVAIFGGDDIPDNAVAILSALAAERLGEAI